MPLRTPVTFLRPLGQGLQASLLLLQLRRLPAPSAPALQPDAIVCAQLWSLPCQAQMGLPPH